MSARIDVEAIVASLGPTHGRLLMEGYIGSAETIMDVADALRSQQREIDRLTAALAEADRRTRFWIKASDMAQDRGAAQMRERAAADVLEWGTLLTPVGERVDEDVAADIRALPLREPQDDGDVAQVCGRREAECPREGGAG